MLEIIAFAVAAATKPVPLSEPGSWIRDSDYPAYAETWNLEGSVEVVLSVSPTGRVSGCTVAVSSGIMDLDSATCALLEQRARFKPARLKGRPVAGDYRKKVNWSQPADAVEEGTSRTLFSVSPDGQLFGCKEVRFGGQSAGFGCDAQAFKNIVLNYLEKPLIQYSRVAFDINARTGATSLKELPSFGTERKLVTEMTILIAPDGKVTSCESTPIRIGSEAFSLCQRRSRFVASRGTDQRKIVVTAEIAGETR